MDASREKDAKRARRDPRLFETAVETAPRASAEVDSARFDRVSIGITRRLCARVFRCDTPQLYSQHFESLNNVEFFSPLFLVGAGGVVPFGGLFLFDKNQWSLTLPLLC